MTEPTVDVTVLIPVLDEAGDLPGCIDAVGAQAFPLDRTEVLVIDGGSSDGSAEIAQATLGRYDFAHAAVLHNPRRGTAANLSTGLAAARGRVVIRVDGRSRVNPDHVATAVDILDRHSDVGVVGGPQHTLARDPGWRSAGVARALRNRWSTGLARYRRSRSEGPADTVWMGAFRTAELRSLGGWDAGMGTNQDYELNERFRAWGSVVWFCPRMVAGYLPRIGHRALAEQYLRYGLAKGRRFSGGAPMAPRHLGLLATVPVVGAAMILSARRIGTVPTAAIGCGLLFAVDAAGSSAGGAGLATRVQSVVTILVTDSCWWLGAVLGLVRR